MFHIPKMGVCTSVEAQKNRKIDKKLENDFVEDQRSIKLLLLGPGECGKSTILKQMRILHMNGFDRSQLMEYRMVIFSNIITSMQAILAAMDTLKIKLGNSALEKERGLVMEALKGKNAWMMEYFEKDVFEAIKILWTDTGVQQCYDRSAEYQLIDSIKYFFDNFDRINDKDYRPTIQDTLMARAATTGIVEVVFPHQGITFRVFDVGGQRAERRKWIHCFDQVNAVIFVVAISDYNLKMREDENTNRMTDSMALFDEICNNKWFQRADIILFFNKRDLFEQKIKKENITVAFPEYKGPQNYESCFNYINDQFQALKANQDKNIATHDTCATDSDQVQIVIDNVIQIIIQKNLRGIMG